MAEEDTWGGLMLAEGANWKDCWREGWRAAGETEEDIINLEQLDHILPWGGLLKDNKPPTVAKAAEVNDSLEGDLGEQNFLRGQKETIREPSGETSIC